MRYGLIGEKLGHSFSKEIHESLESYKYDLCEIPKDELPSFLQKREFCAINVTIPYKAEVIPYLDWVDEKAKKLCSVNTVVNRNGKLYGYNTDYLGMRDMIERSGISLTGKKVLVLGTGATSRTSALVASDLGARETVLVSRTQKNGAITYEEAEASHTDANVIINATPVGMYPNGYASPISLEGFSSLEAVFDAVYNPLRTKLVLDAKSRGIYAEGGLYMLISQAAHAIGLFTGKDITNIQIEEIYRKVFNSKENIVLIGMPSSGKTTVGKIIADALGRKLFDLDDEIERRIGCTISEFFEKHSEKEFRDIESQITKEISARHGAVIATGGGCILRNENVDALRSCGRLYFLDRSLKYLIPTQSRPLARRPGDLENLFKIRHHLYMRASDVRVDGDKDAQNVAKYIKEDFCK